MKMIMLNVNPHKKFNREKSILIKVQIDNSLDLMGWKAEDIILATNFEYEYRGVRSILVEDDNYCDIDTSRYSSMVSTHIGTIENLFRLGKIADNEMYFYHDIDAYQIAPISIKELNMGSTDFALTDYGWSQKWNLGVIFFTSKAYDLFKLINDTIYSELVPDERSFRNLVNRGTIPKNRFTKLNITYNLGMRNIHTSYAMAQLPLKIIHFHPIYYDNNMENSTMNIFWHGENSMKKVLVPDSLKDIFRKYGINDTYGRKCNYRDFVHSISYDP